MIGSDLQTVVVNANSCTSAYNCDLDLPLSFKCSPIMGRSLKFSQSSPPLILICDIDFQNRVGSKFGGGGVADASQANIDRRERLRKLALETIDLAKVWEDDKFKFRILTFNSRIRIFSATILDH